MLQWLEIRNLALIDSLLLEFCPRLNVITGETGAGKSILIGALGIVLGGKGRSDIVRAGADSAEVTALFVLGEKHPALKRVQGSEDGLLQISRTVSRKGRSSCTVNGRRAAVSELRAIAEDLADIHSQRDQQSLLKKIATWIFWMHSGGLSREETRSAMLTVWF